MAMEKGVDAGWKKATEKSVDAVWKKAMEKGVYDGNAETGAFWIPGILELRKILDLQPLC